MQSCPCGWAESDGDILADVGAQVTLDFVPSRAAHETTDALSTLSIR